MVRWGEGTHLARLLQAAQVAVQRGRVDSSVVMVVLSFSMTA